MTDRYIAFANSPVDRRLVGAVGLPSPLRLERWQAGRVRSVDGPLVIGGSGALAEAVLPFAGKLTDAVFAAVEGQFELPRWTAEHSPRAKAVLFDASGLTRFEQLVALRDFFQPVLKGLDTCPKVVVLGRAPESLKDPVAASVQRSLEGFTRSLGKEIRRGGNVQLLYVGKGAEDQLEGALRFFLSPKSAYVSGQVIRLAANSAQVHDWSKPLAGQRALVTGAARGIGAAIAETLARDGAEVVLLDVPPAREALEGLAARLGGRAVALDICAADAGQQLVDALPEGVDIVVHNAGITRDKTLAKMSSDFWNSVINVNLNAPQVLTQALLDGGKLHDNEPGGIAGVDQRHRRQPRAEQLRGEQGRPDRPGPGLGAGAGQARHHHQRGGAGLHRDADDRRHSADHPRGRPADELHEPGRPAAGRRRNGGLVRPAVVRRGQRPGAEGVRAEPAGGLRRPLPPGDRTPTR